MTRESKRGQSRDYVTGVSTLTLEAVHRWHESYTVKIFILRPWALPVAHRSQRGLEYSGWYFPIHSLNK